MYEQSSGSSYDLGGKRQIAEEEEAVQIEGRREKDEGDLALKQQNSKKIESTALKYQFADYNAASLVLQNLEMIYNDMVDNGGIQYKILLNDMLSESRSALAIRD